MKLSEAWTYSICCWVQTRAPYEGPLIPVVRLSEGLSSSTGQSRRPTGMAGSCIRSISFQIWLFLVSMLVFGGVFPPGFLNKTCWKFLKGKTDPRFGHPTGKDSHGVREPMGLGWDLTFSPPCQVRVVRFYVSLLLVLLLVLLLLRVLLSFSSPTAMMCAQCSAPDLNRDPVSSVFRAGPRPRSCEFMQCSAPDLNRDPVRPVFRAGPQPRSCEFSVPRRTSTAIL